MNPRVYLAGGFRSRWQDKVREACPRLEFIDPSSHGLERADQFTAWDLFQLAKCELVLAVMETGDFPAYGLVLEIGFAKARGKLIVLVDERSRLDDDDDSFTRYFAIVRAAADVVCGSLDEAISFVNSFGNVSS